MTATTIHVPSSRGQAVRDESLAQRREWFNSKKVLPWLLIAPVQIIMLLILILPLILALVASFKDYAPFMGQTSLWESEWIGLDNYKRLFSEDGRFLASVLRTLLFAGICLSIEFALGLLMAVIFMRKFAGKKMMFSFLLTPMMILPVVVGYTFWMLFQANGPVNQILSLLALSHVQIDWLRNGTWAFVAVVVAEVWHWTPLFFLILLSGMNSVPENPVRAAAVLGASRWQIFWKVIFPMLRPVIVVAFVIRAMEILKLFDEVYLLTKGGPGTSTETISMYIYKLAFNDSELSFAAAAAFIVLVVTLVLIYLMLLPIRNQLLEKGGR